MFIQLTAIGNLGSDPEMKFAQDGEKTYTRFSMAVNRRWTGKDGQKQEETTWLRCTAFGGLAESINAYLGKGDPVFIQGRLDPNEDGNPQVWGDPPRASFEVIVETCRFLGKAGGGRASAAPSAPAGLADGIEF